MLKLRLHPEQSLQLPNLNLFLRSQYRLPHSSLLEVQHTVLRHSL